MLEFEKYLSDFNATIDLNAFLINFIVVALLSFILRAFYIKYGRALSDRSKFASIFLPLALATFLIITVIKSSIALSLGLVGALSIVRFRAAIKDPEELTYLFLIIGLGIVGGANKPILACLSFALILPLLYFNSIYSNSEKVIKGKTHLNIKTSFKGVSVLTEAISKHLPYLELKRIDLQSDNNFYNFVGKIENTTQIEQIKNAILELDPEAHISMIDQPEIIL